MEGMEGSSCDGHQRVSPPGFRPCVSHSPKEYTGLTAMEQYGRSNGMLLLRLGHYKMVASLLGDHSWGSQWPCLEAALWGNSREWARKQIFPEVSLERTTAQPSLTRDLVSQAPG